MLCGSEACTDGCGDQISCRVWGAPRTGVHRAPARDDRRGDPAARLRQRTRAGASAAVRAAREPAAFLRRQGRLGTTRGAHRSRPDRVLPGRRVADLRRLGEAAVLRRGHRAGAGLWLPVNAYRHRTSGRGGGLAGPARSAAGVHHPPHPGSGQRRGHPAGRHAAHPPPRRRAQECVGAQRVDLRDRPQRDHRPLPPGRHPPGAAHRLRDRPRPTRAGRARARRGRAAHRAGRLPGSSAGAAARDLSRRTAAHRSRRAHPGRRSRTTRPIDLRNEDPGTARPCPAHNAIR